MSKKFPRRQTSVSSLVALSATVVLATSILVSPTLARSPHLRDRLVSYGFLRQPQNFVELSFPDPRDVRKFADWNGRLEVSFALSSHLATGTSILWTLESASEGAEARTLQAGAITLENAQTSKIKAVGRVTCEKRRVKVTVRAEPVNGAAFPPEEIHFWVVRDAEVVVGGVKETSCKVP